MEALQHRCGSPKILLVKLKQIGDALILTPTIRAIRNRYPEAFVCVVVRSGIEGILQGCSGIDRIITSSPIKGNTSKASLIWSEIKNLLFLRSQNFDYAFELTDGDRGRFYTMMSGAKIKSVNTSFYQVGLWWKMWFNSKTKKPWNRGHRVEKDYFAVSEVLPLGEIPSLQFEEQYCTIPSEIRGIDEFVVLHPCTRWRRKRWPRERWVSLGQKLAGKVRNIVISCGPNEKERRFSNELAEDLGGHFVSTDGRWSWADMAGALRKAKAYIGVDTAAMHLAAACGCPIVALFGESIDYQWKPWNSPHIIVSAETHEGNTKSMENISTENVVSAYHKLLERKPGLPT